MAHYGLRTGGKWPTLDVKDVDLTGRCLTGLKRRSDDVQSASSTKTVRILSHYLRPTGAALRNHPAFFCPLRPLDPLRTQAIGAACRPPAQTGSGPAADRAVAGTPAARLLRCAVRPRVGNQDHWRCWAHHCWRSRPSIFGWTRTSCSKWLWRRPVPPGNRRAVIASNPSTPFEVGACPVHHRGTSSAGQAPLPGNGGHWADGPLPGPAGRLLAGLRPVRGRWPHARSYTSPTLGGET